HQCDLAGLHVAHRKSRGDCGLARWGIVLAGGEGARMRPLIVYWTGGDRPKQYCTFVGSRSMFQHTVDRARSVVSEKHVVTIIGPGHPAVRNGKFFALCVGA
ncbi:MAG: NTP transferase domain-containing protein, partial [candidate division WOR-3 bacterium]|nr:NTP transferase domain-containing protein [candidate division WOR-3 bacterium]